MRRSSALLVVPAVALFVAACGGSAASPSPPPVASPSPTAASTEATASTGPATPAAVLTPAASGAATAVAAATTVSVVLVDYAFQPDAITVPAGDITFSLRNEGAEEHEFEIFRGDQVVDEAEGLIPGLERDFSVTLAPGQYTFVCKLADHEQRGMVGTLTVTES
jgi:plastocyanin